MTRVIVVHHDIDIGDQEVDSLRRLGYDPVGCAGPSGGSCPVLRGEHCSAIHGADVLVYDVWSTSESGGGRTLIEGLREMHPEIPDRADGSRHGARLGRGGGHPQGRPTGGRAYRGATRCRHQGGAGQVAVCDPPQPVLQLGGVVSRPGVLMPWCDAAAGRGVVWMPRLLPPLGGRRTYWCSPVLSAPEPSGLVPQRALASEPASFGTADAIWQRRPTSRSAGLRAVRREVEREARRGGGPHVILLCA